MFRTILALLIVFAPVYGNGQTAEDCIGITNDSYRLACFDNLFGSQRSEADEPGIASTNNTGVWQVNIEEDPFDDTTQVLLLNDSSQGTSNVGVPFVLGIVCNSGNTDVLIAWEEFLGLDDGIYVQYRVGKQEAQTSMWELYGNGEFTYYAGNSVELIQQMLEIDGDSTDGVFTAQAIGDYGGGIAVWNLYGLTEAIAPLRQACSW